MIDDKREQEIRERLEAATPGPWDVWWWRALLRDLHNLVSFPDDFCENEVDFDGARYPGWSGRDMADGDFIANAPADIRDLLDAIAERDAEIAALKHDIDRLVAINEAEVNRGDG